MGKSLIPAQRRERILEYLTIHKIVANSDLCQWLGVSDATVRRDLESMEEDGLVERTHGGALLNQRMLLESEYQLRAGRFQEEKRSIGILAASQIEPGDIVFINSGTTTTQIFRHLHPNLEATIITNNLIAALEAGSVNYEILLLGGSFQAKSNSAAGRFAIDNLNHVYANKAFIGVDGISLKHGCTVPTNAEAEVVRAMIGRIQGQINIVMDHSKWGVVSNFGVASLSEIHKLITDSGLSDHARAALAARSVELLIAGVGAIVSK
jgi:DeoR family fructose operon transcriptional repressor